MKIGDWFLFFGRVFLIRSLCLWCSILPPEYFLSEYIWPAGMRKQRVVWAFTVGFYNLCRPPPLSLARTVTCL